MRKILLHIGYSRAWAKAMEILYAVPKFIVYSFIETIFTWVPCTTDTLWGPLDKRKD